jgi:glycolate oxidase FAD binding subunit
MSLQPHSIPELCDALAAANQAGRPLHHWNLAALAAVVEHKPEDMTATVQAGCTLATLQKTLAVHGQWLPMDPPAPQTLTIGALLALNASGPRRFGHGTIREHLIGLTAVLADGRLIHSGGKVVKNVAGYDLMKLFVGSRGTLGIIVEATFKVLPRPGAEHIVRASCDSLDHAGALIERVLASPITPVVLDLHNLADDGLSASPRCHVVLGFAGTEREVEWQAQQAAGMGFDQPADLSYDGVIRCAGDSDAALHTRSVLPSRLIGTLRELGSVPFVARAGNGVIHHRGGPAPAQTDLPLALMRRVKDTFDPQHILPPLPW